MEMKTCQVHHKKEISAHARLVASGAKKLSQHKTLHALTIQEFRAAREVVRAAVRHVNSYIANRPDSNKLPRTFIWKGARYSLEYSTFGRVTVRVSGCGAKFSSGVDTL